MTAPVWDLRAVRGGQYVLMQLGPAGMWTDMATCDNLGSARLVLELVTEGETARARGNGAPRDLIGPGHASRGGYSPNVVTDLTQIRNPSRGPAPGTTGPGHAKYDGRQT